MNKKEVSEIKKQLNPDAGVINKLCGCYVDAEKNIKLKFTKAFNSIPEEEAFKYYDIFRHTLSGSLGKNLINMDFPLEEELNDGMSSFLLELRNSALENESLTDRFYEAIIEHYDYNMNYFIILIHGTYDIPGKTTDGIWMEDASDNVYEYILCSICPVNLSKAGLVYNSLENDMTERLRDWTVEMPAKGFVFPNFNERTPDIHSILYYSKNPKELQMEFIENVLGTEVPLSAPDQQDTFNAIISKTFRNNCDYERVKTIHDTINEMIEENKETGEPLSFSKEDVRRILINSGANPDEMEDFDKDYDETAGYNAKLLAPNITNTRKLNIEAPDIVIKVNPIRSDLVQTKIIDGRQCIVIAVDDHIEINGLTVKTIGK